MNTKSWKLPQFVYVLRLWIPLNWNFSVIYNIIVFFFRRTFLQQRMLRIFMPVLGTRRRYWRRRRPRNAHRRRFPVYRVLLAGQGCVEYGLAYLHFRVSSVLNTSTSLPFSIALIENIVTFSTACKRSSNYYSVRSWRWFVCTSSKRILNFWLISNVTSSYIREAGRRNMKTSDQSSRWLNCISYVQMAVLCALGWFKSRRMPLL